MKVRVVSGSHKGLTGEIKHDLAERISTLGKDGKVTVYYQRTRGARLSTVSIRVKHLVDDLDLFHTAMEFKDFPCPYCGTIGCLKTHERGRFLGLGIGEP